MVLLDGLSSEYEAIVSSASLSPISLPFQRLVDALLECEAHQRRTDHDVLVAANTVEGLPLQLVDQSTDGSFRGGRSSVHGRGRSFHPCIQCQICSRYGHLARRCYYRYYRDEQSSLEPLVARRGCFALGIIGED